MGGNSTIRCTDCRTTTWTLVAIEWSSCLDLASLLLVNWFLGWCVQSDSDGDSDGDGDDSGGGDDGEDNDNDKLSGSGE